MKFDYNDRVDGFIDGFGMRRGYVIDIQEDSEFPYLLRCTDGSYCVFAEDELVLLDPLEVAV